MYKPQINYIPQQRGNIWHVSMNLWRLFARSSTSGVCIFVKTLLLSIMWAFPMRHPSILTRQYVSVAHVHTYVQAWQHRSKQKPGDLFRISERDNCVSMLLCPVPAWQYVNVTAWQGVSVSTRLRDSDTMSEYRRTNTFACQKYNTLKLAGQRKSQSSLRACQHFSVTGQQHNALAPGTTYDDIMLR